MKRRKKSAAARHRAAAFCLLVGVLLPCLLPRGGLRVPKEVEALLEETLAGETDPLRIAYVRTACGTVGRVAYFWGGKSHALGWDSAWGWPERVTAAGSETTGKYRRYGLDCSGLVSWAASAALDDRLAYGAVGEGVGEQYARCRPAAEPRSGDLAFFPDLSHVGIVLGRDRAGTVWVVHSSASRGGVVVTPASVGFALYGTPLIFPRGGVDEKNIILYTGMEIPTG